MFTANRSLKPKDITRVGLNNAGKVGFKNNSLTSKSNSLLASKGLLKSSEAFDSHLAKATKKLEGKPSTMSEMEKSKRLDQIMAGFRKDLGMKALSNKEKLRRAAIF